MGGLQQFDLALATTSSQTSTAEVYERSVNLHNACYGKAVFDYISRSVPIYCVRTKSHDRSSMPQAGTVYGTKQTALFTRCIRIRKIPICVGPAMAEHIGESLNPFGKARKGPVVLGGT